MHTIPWLAELEDLSGFEMTAVGMIILVSAWGAGYMTDNAMGKFGMGPAVNGVIALLGVCAGVYLRYRYVVAPADWDAGLTLGFAASTPIVLLLAIGVVRGRLF
jgi:hypothetical protein